MSRGSQIFTSFLIILCSTILILLPVSDGVYDYRTDLREDNFTVITGAGTDNSTIQLFKSLYDDDTSTIDLLSHDADDSPYLSSYNTTTRALVVAGLGENITRIIDVTYDIEADNMSGGISGFLDILPWIWILIWVAFPAAAVIAIWTGRG